MDMSFPAFTGIPALMKSRFQYLYSFSAKFWKLLAQTHIFFRLIRIFSPSGQLTSMNLAIYIIKGGKKKKTLIPGMFLFKGH